MDSNEQTELTSKIETDSQRERRIAAWVGGEVRGWRDGAKRKKDNSMVIVGEGGGYKGAK